MYHNAAFPDLILISDLRASFSFGRGNNFSATESGTKIQVLCCPGQFGGDEGCLVGYLDHLQASP